MAYMLLVMEPTDQRRERGEVDGRAAYDRMLQFGEELRSRGLLLGSESLRSHAQAARVAVRGGRPQVVDGPFAEAKEMVGGYFLIDCATFEEAVEWAARCPAAQWCTVEVRALAPCYDDALQ